ncbi:MAG: hypothetical protein KJ731_16270 [Alphaproteobacteria bacterium]|nr:hypothetical protein [Alphaproteobacteria bacterium]
MRLIGILRRSYKGRPRLRDNTQTDPWRIERQRPHYMRREDLFGREFLLLDHLDLYDDRAGRRMDRFDGLEFMNL